MRSVTKTGTHNFPFAKRGFGVIVGVGMLEVISEAHTFYLPCPFKSVTGIDCPGCGFQRSVVALWEGDLMTSFEHYPPTIPLLALFLFLGLKWVFKWDDRDRLTRILGIVVGGIVLVSYGVKLMGIFLPAHAH